MAGHCVLSCSTVSGHVGCSERMYSSPTLSSSNYKHQVGIESNKAFMQNAKSFSITAFVDVLRQHEMILSLSWTLLELVTSNFTNIYSAIVFTFPPLQQIASCMCLPLNPNNVTLLFRLRARQVLKQLMVIAIVWKSVLVFQLRIQQTSKTEHEQNFKTWNQTI